MFCLTLSGCELMQPQAQAPVPPRTVEYKLPVLTPVEPGKQEQEKDGIHLSIAGYNYTPQSFTHTFYRSVPTILLVNDAYPAEMWARSSISVKPKEVCFKIKINNRLERVLRLAGTVVSFQVAGKSVAVDKTRYENFLNGIILPRQEGEYEILGPDLATLPDNATIGLFLYDIVTATDAAGNPTQRSNFEFFYTLTRETKSQEIAETKKQIYLKQNQAALLQRREAANPGKWVTVPEFGQ